AEEGLSVLFFSPSKILRARELQDVKEAAKEQEARDKVSRAKARAAQKAQKESEAQQKRDGRATRAEARKAEEALKKAQREKDREARRAQKQLETESKASQKRPRGRPPKQKKAQEPPAIESEPNDEVVSVQPKSRNGRIIRKSVHFDETSSAASTDDALAAVAVAERAFPAWSSTKPGHRRDLFLRAAEELVRRKDDLWHFCSKETGSTEPYFEFDFNDALESLKSCAGLIATVQGSVPQILVEDRSAMVAFRINGMIHSDRAEYSPRT
ncbi:hypothetical protein B0A54_17654, partial [Friedmanniomyces endolithicus]